MDEAKITNSKLKARTKFLIDWAVSLETGGTISVIEGLINKTEFTLGDKSNVAHSLLIGLLNRYNPEFTKLDEKEIKQLINEGFQIRLERKRKRLKTGIITRVYFENEFPNGGDIFDWLIANKILKKITLIKGFFKEISADQWELLKVTFPENPSRILAILEVSQVVVDEPKPKYFYQRMEDAKWRSV